MFITLFLTQIVVLYLFCTSHSYRKQERKLRPCTFTFVLLFCELVTRNFACSTARLNDGSGCEPKIRPTCFLPCSFASLYSTREKFPTLMMTTFWFPPGVDKTAPPLSSSTCLALLAEAVPRIGAVLFSHPILCYVTPMGFLGLPSPEGAE